MRQSLLHSGNTIVWQDARLVKAQVDISTRLQGIPIFNKGKRCGSNNPEKQTRMHDYHLLSTRAGCLVVARNFTHWSKSVVHRFSSPIHEVSNAHASILHGIPSYLIASLCSKRMVTDVQGRNTASNNQRQVSRMPSPALDAAREKTNDRKILSNSTRGLKDMSPQNTPTYVRLSARTIKFIVGTTYDDNHGLSTIESLLMHKRS